MRSWEQRAASRRDVLAGGQTRVFTPLCLSVLWGVAWACGIFPVGQVRGEPLRIDNAAAEKKPYPEVEEGKKKLLKQDFEGALESFNAAAKAHPDLSNGRVLISNVYFTSNRPREGRVQLEKAVVEYPDDPEPYVMMGEFALREGRWTDARLLGDRAIVLARASKANAEKKIDLVKRAYLVTAAAAQAHEAWETTRTLLADLLKVAPDSGVGHFRLGQVLFEMKKPKEAFAELQAAARLDDEVPSPEATLAQLYDKAKDRVNAEKWMRNAVAADPKKLKTRLEVGQWYLRSGQVDDAKTHAEEALVLEPNSPEALFLAGRVARYAKDYATAQKYLEKSYLEAPGAKEVANELALTLAEMGEDERKRAFTLAEATYRQSRDAEVAATLGWICYRMGHMEDAERMFNAVGTATSVTPDAVYFFAMMMDERNRGELVRPMLEAALKTDGLFAYRAEAQKLHDRIAKKAARTPSKSPAKAAAKTNAIDLDGGEEPAATAPAAKPAAAKAEKAKPSAAKQSPQKPSADKTEPAKPE